MTKRKASVTASKSDAQTKGLTLDIDPAQIEAIKQEHRQYMIDSGIIDEKMPVPPRKKVRKTIAKKSEAAIPIVLASIEAPETKVTSKVAYTKLEKTTTNEKRKAEELKPALPPADLNEDNDKLDGPANADLPPPAKKQKKAPVKSKAKAKPTTSDSPAPQTSSEAEPTAKPKAKSKAKGKAQATTAAKEGKNESASSADVEANPSPPPRAILGRLLLCKIKQVKDLATSLPTQPSLLDRDATNLNLIHLPGLNLTGILTRMHADYQLSTDDSSLADIDSIIVDRFIKELPETPGETWRHVTIDLSLPFTLQDILQEKLRGHGLEGINLLEVEMEMFQQRVLQERQSIVEVEKIIYPMDASRKFFNEVWSGVQARAEKEWMAEKEEAGEDDALPLTERFEREEELPSKGVCPAAPMVVF